MQAFDESLSLQQVLEFLKKKDAQDTKKLQDLQEKLQAEKAKATALSAELQAKESQLRKKDAELQVLTQRKTTALTHLKAVRDALEGNI
jgi:hypothetical protein